MDKQSAVKIVKDTFENPFDKARYINLIKNLFKTLDTTGNFQWAGNRIPNAGAFMPHINSIERIGKSTVQDKSEDQIDVLIVNLKKDTSLEYARTMQRNFVARYLDDKNRKAALVAFVPPDPADWRFSLMEMEYSLGETPAGRTKVEKELTPARRYSFLVGEDESSHTAQIQLLEILRNDEKKPLLEDFEKAFNIEVVTKEFFTKYRELFYNTETALQNLVKQDEKVRNEFTLKGIDTVNFAKKLLGQIVFLYFLQKKGWFGVGRDDDWGAGPKDFLRRLFEKKVISYQNFFNDILEPLFYNTLALERSEDYSDRFNCKIPFLNGGLFDPIKDYFWVSVDILLPNELFSNKETTPEGDIGTGILDVFDRYNFTVKEDEPLDKEVAVDPEMLGKVFENLLEVKDRKSKGTYYTPREIVHYMCQESLINYLDTALNTGAVPLVKEKPTNLKLFGAPAFQQQALKTTGNTNNITREDIETFIRTGETAIEHDTRVEATGKETKDYTYKTPPSIRLNAAAIDEALADIRVCDPAIGSGAFPVGLMTEIIRARNTLTTYLPEDKERTNYHFKRHAIQNCLYGVDIDPGAVEIAKLRLWLSLVVDEEDIKQIQPLPNLDYKIVCGNSLRGIKRAANDMFGNEIERLKFLYFSETNPKKKIEHRQQIDKLISSLTNNEKIFDFGIYFSEVFHEKGGFDVVIANPPYIKEYVNREAFDGIRDSPYYKGKMDIWYLFACQGIDHLKNNGTLAFIAQNNWVTSYGASKLRNKVITETRIMELLDFGDYKIFDTPGIQTMVMVFSKATKNDIYKFDYRRVNAEDADFHDILDLLNLRLNSTNEYLEPTINKKILSDATLTFSSSGISDIIKKIEGKTNFKLAEVEVAQGIVPNPDVVTKSGIEKIPNSKIVKFGISIGDGVFVIPRGYLKNLSLVEKSYIKPLYEPSDLDRYFIANTYDKEIIYSTKKNWKSGLKHIVEHLEKYKEIMEDRRENKTEQLEYYHLHWPRDARFFMPGPKIFCVRKCAAPTFAYTESEAYVMMAINVIKTDRANQKLLTAILSSKLIAFWLKNKGKMQGNNYQIDKEPLLAIPIYKPSDSEQKPVIALVDQILAAKATDKKSNVAGFENQIDQLVYELYGLTPEEIAIVEGKKGKLVLSKT